METYLSKDGRQEKGDDDGFSWHVAGRFFRYFSFIKDRMSPVAPKALIYY